MMRFFALYTGDYRSKTEERKYKDSPPVRLHNVYIIIITEVKSIRDCATSPHRCASSVRISQLRPIVL